jgi:mitochondrial fission protein ELM1
VIGSRRTPSAMRRQIKQALGDRAQVWMDDRDGPNPYAGVIAWADRLVVTPDSANLISEAAATRALLWIAVPRYNRGRIRHLVAKAIDSGRARALGPESTPWPIEPWRESARVAARLRPWVLETITERQPAADDNAPADKAARNADAVP